MRRRARCRRADERVRVAQTRLPAASFAHRATDRVGPVRRVKAIVTEFRHRARHRPRARRRRGGGGQLPRRRRRSDGGRAADRALARRADVSREPEVRELFQRAVEHLGTVDILVNNAGLQRDAPFEQLSLEQWNITI